MPSGIARDLPCSRYLLIGEIARRREGKLQLEAGEAFGQVAGLSLFAEFVPEQSQALPAIAPRCFRDRVTA
jgi:hypothetical protein